MTTLQELLDDPWFPFEGDVKVKQLQDLVVPEPDRQSLTPESCGSCAQPESAFLWANEHWRLRSYGEATAVPGIVLLETREHLDSYADMGEHLLAEIGPLTARIEQALLSLGGIARVHVARYGDGTAHFHQWFFPRPLGQLQLRGSMLPVWLDVLPPVDPSVEADLLARLGSALRYG